MISKETIQSIVEPYLAEKGFFLVSIKCSPANEIEILIDSMESIDIDQCIQLSRYIETRLNRDEEDFELTVGSAGIGDPFKIPEQYRKHTGKEVEVVLRNGNKLKGILSDVRENTIKITYEKKMPVEGKKKKEIISVTDELLFSDIKTTRLVIKF